MRDLLSELVIHVKYARYKDNRRESWDEIVDRVFDMHREKFDGFHYMFDLSKDMVRRKLVVPSMRSIQFAGDAIKSKHERMYNCSFLPIKSFEDICDLFTLCMVGVGVGFNLFETIDIVKPTSRLTRHVVGDSVEGWVDALRAVLNAYITGKDVELDYSQIRPKGAYVKGINSYAPGYEVLETGLERIREILNNCNGKAGSLEIFDICTILGDVATCGGTRRSALIAFFDKNDFRMLSSKYDGFWEHKPWRSRANISVQFDRKDLSGLKDFLRSTLGNNTGEPGLFISGSREWGTNPCAEIALRPYSFCNLTSINAKTLEDDKTFFEACSVATFLGTIQSTYDDFRLVNPEFRKNSIEERLLGVSITGLSNYDLKEVGSLLRMGAEYCNRQNRLFSNMLGINPAHRITCIKPEGTTSLVMGTSAGVHAEESDYYIRNIRVSKDRGIIPYLQSINYPLLEQDTYNSNDMVVGVPIKATGKTIYQQSAFDLVDDIVNLNKNWIRPGHNVGINKHNVSTTLRVKKEEVIELAERLDLLKDNYTAVAYLPHSDVVYPQAPNQAITKKEFDAIKLPEVDLSKVVENFKIDDFLKDGACEGAACVVK